MALQPQNWLWLLPILFTVLSTIVFTADKIPYISDWFFPNNLIRGKELLESNERLSEKQNKEAFRAVMNALDEQNRIPLNYHGIEDEITKLAIYRQDKSKSLATYFDNPSSQPWYAESFKWNHGSNDDGWWEWFGPYSSINSSIETQIEQETPPKGKIGVFFLVLFFISSVALQFV